MLHTHFTRFLLRCEISSCVCCFASKIALKLVLHLKNFAYIDCISVLLYKYIQPAATRKENFVIFIQRWMGFEEMECTYSAIIVVYRFSCSHTMFFPIDSEIYLTICVVTAIFHMYFFLLLEPRFHYDKWKVPIILGFLIQS